jgi:nitroreductase
MAAKRTRRPRPTIDLAGAQAAVDGHKELAVVDPIDSIEAIDLTEVAHLEDLQQLLGHAHHAAEQHQAEAVRAAAAAGRILAEVQHRLKGTGVSFSTWCENAGLPRRTAYNYLKVAERVDASPELCHRGTTVRELLGNTGTKALPAARLPVPAVERFRLAAEARGIKPTELLATIVERWLEEHEGAIDIDAG